MQEPTVHYHRILSPQYRLSNTFWHDIPVAESCAGSPPTLRRSVSLPAFEARASLSSALRRSSTDSVYPDCAPRSSRFSDDSSLIPVQQPGALGRLKSELKAKVSILRQYSSYASLRSGSNTAMQRSRTSFEQLPVVIDERTPRATLRSFGQHSNGSTVRNEATGDDGQGSPLSVWFSASESAPSSPSDERRGQGRPSTDSVLLPEDFRSSLLELSSSLDSVSSLGFSLSLGSDDTSSERSAAASSSSWRLQALRPLLGRRSRSEAVVETQERARERRLSLLPAPPSQESLTSAFLRGTSIWAPATGSSYSSIDIYAPVFPEPTEPQEVASQPKPPRRSLGAASALDTVLIDADVASLEEKWGTAYGRYQLNAQDVGRLQRRSEGGPRSTLSRAMRTSAKVMRTHGLYYTGVCATPQASEEAWRVLREQGLLDRRNRLREPVDFGQILAASLSTSLSDWDLAQKRGLTQYLQFAWQATHPEKAPNELGLTNMSRPTDYSIDGRD